MSAWLRYPKVKIQNLTLCTPATSGTGTLYLTALLVLSALVSAISYYDGQPAIPLDKK